VYANKDQWDYLKVDNIQKHKHHNDFQLCYLCNLNIFHSHHMHPHDYCNCNLFIFLLFIFFHFGSQRERERERERERKRRNKEERKEFKVTDASKSSRRSISERTARIHTNSIIKIWLRTGIVTTCTIWKTSSCAICTIWITIWYFFFVFGVFCFRLWLRFSHLLCKKGKERKERRKKKEEKPKQIPWLAYFPNGHVEIQLPPYNTLIIHSNDVFVF